MTTVKNYPMKCDVREKKDAYLLEVDLPGCQKEDMKAYVEDGYLHIEASLNKEKKQGHGKFVHRECFCGEYERSFQLGEDVDASKIRAGYKHGVLKLYIPKMNREALETKNVIAIC